MNPTPFRVSLSILEIQPPTLGGREWSPTENGFQTNGSRRKFYRLSGLSKVRAGTEVTTPCFFSKSLYFPLHSIEPIAPYLIFRKSAADTGARI